LKEGTGEGHPGAGDTAVVNPIGWTADGKLVDESLTHGAPGPIAVARMFPGLAEGVRLMVEGEKRRLWIPGELAFGEAKPGEAQAKEGPPRGMLVYDVELVGIETPGPKPAESAPGE
jgi:FKBP-type peptidyl-prolyl cis-trans isomerase